MVETILTLYPAASEEFVEEVIFRIESLGVTLTEDDAAILAFIISDVINHIRIVCSVPSLPEGAEPAAARLAVAGFIEQKYRTGALDMAGLSLGGIVTSIKEGDVTVSFDSSATDDANLISLLTSMKNSAENDLWAFRRIKW